MSDSFHVEGVTTVFESHVFHVEKRTIVGGDEPFDRDIAVHPGAVAVLVINERGEIGLISQYRSSFDRVMLEVPAGTRDKEGEDPLDTAKRELLEELGVTATDWKLLGRFMNSPGWSNQVMVIYEARGLSLGKREPAGPEESRAEVLWLSPEGLRSRLRSEPAIDSTTAIALHQVFGRFFDDI